MPTTFSETDTRLKPIRDLDAKTAVMSREFGLSGSLYASLEFTSYTTGSGSHSIWTVEVSNDGINWYGVPSGALTYTTPALSPVIPVGMYEWIRVRLSTLSTYTTETVSVILRLTNDAAVAVGGTGATGATGSAGATGATGAAGAAGTNAGPVSVVCVSTVGTTNTTTPPGATRCYAEGCASGGGGGRASGSGSGGSSGTLGGKLYTGLTPSSTVMAVVIGAVGTGKVTTDGNGTDAANTTISDGTTTVTLPGGKKGLSSGASSGTAANATNADWYIAGPAGSTASVAGPGGVVGSAGGPSMMFNRGAGGDGDPQFGDGLDGVAGVVRLIFFP